MRNGDWYRDFGSAEPLYHTLTASRTAGAELSFTFQGMRVECGFARGPNYGEAEIAIDGTTVARVDLYAPESFYRQQIVFDAVVPGTHTITVRVAGKKDLSSRDSVVALDSIRVFE